jgi:beta-mannosidase
MNYNLFIMGAALLAPMSFHSASAQRVALSDTTQWQFRLSGAEHRVAEANLPEGVRLTDWREASVPGTIHDDLLRHGLILDPFYGTNEDSVQWVENRDWEYRTSFTLDSARIAAADEVMLAFDGLDTFADIYLNGARIGSTDNMFVGFEFPVKEYLRVGDNRLQLLFHSPMKMAMGQFETAGFVYPADNDHRAERVSIFTRKAPYSYGWDWGIRLATSGVWRPVRLEFVDKLKIDNLHVRQQSLTDASANLSLAFELDNVTSQSCKAEVEAVVSFEGKRVASRTLSLDLKPGVTLDSLSLDIANPQRWMPAGWGKANLYDVSLTARVDGREAASLADRIGLRTVRFVHEPDLLGTSFYFEVNGERVFAKGANFIPNDALLPRMTDERYECLFDDITAANMNMIRVWGGGTYEDDRFYRLADERGILVWQDFMFGCTTYPHDPVFLRNVEKETRYNIRRLRNHPSIVLWCGNNEVEEAVKYWGWQQKYGEQVYGEFWKGYDKLFREVLPAQVAQYDPSRSYVHTSPYSANWGRPASLAHGDSHYWGVWYGQQPFEILDERVPRFMSEFGFQSFPEMKTIATFAGEGDLEIESTVMNSHQKSSIGNHLIRTYMERDYHVPASFDDFVYVGLVLQGQGMRHGFEAHRRNRPFCEGSLYWQLNDSWPVVSWSSIDYYGNWKALHYQAQRAFAPVIINAIEENRAFAPGDTLRELNLYVISDSLGAIPGARLAWQQVDFNGRKIASGAVVNGAVKLLSAVKGSTKVDVPANGNVLAASIPSADITRRTDSYLQLTLTDARGREVARTVYFFAKPKELDLPQTAVSKQMKVRDGRIELTLSASQLAKDLFIELPIQGVRFSDNFFDLLPGEKKRVVITSPEIKAGTNYDIRLRHLRETY